jgi:hypothetical protein
MSDRLRDRFQDEARKVAKLVELGSSRVLGAFTRAYEEHKAIHGSYKYDPEYNKKMSGRYVFMYERVMDFLDSQCNHELMAKVKEHGYRPMDLILNEDLINGKCLDGILKEFAPFNPVLLSGTLLKKESLVPLMPVQIVYGQVSETSVILDAVEIPCRNSLTGKEQVKTLS